MDYDLLDILHYLFLCLLLKRKLFVHLMVQRVLLDSSEFMLFRNVEVTRCVVYELEEIKNLNLKKVFKLHIELVKEDEKKRNLI
jgi:hypothetical protein